MDRPGADELLPVMVDPVALKQGRMRLSAWARRHVMAQVRCQKRHILAAVVRTAYGPWVAWRGGLQGTGLQCAWHEDLPDPGALLVWCSSCSNTTTVNVSDPAAPTRARMR